MEIRKRIFRFAGDAIKMQYKKGAIYELAAFVLLIMSFIFKIVDEIHQEPINIFPIPINFSSFIFYVAIITLLISNGKTDGRLKSSWRNYVLDEIAYSLAGPIILFTMIIAALFGLAFGIQADLDIHDAIIVAPNASLASCVLLLLLYKIDWRSRL